MRGRGYVGFYRRRIGVGVGALCANGVVVYAGGYRVWCGGGARRCRCRGDIASVTRCMIVTTALAVSVAVGRCCERLYVLVVLRSFLDRVRGEAWAWALLHMGVLHVTSVDGMCAHALLEETLVPCIGDRHRGCAGTHVLQQTLPCHTRVTIIAEVPRYEPCVVTV